MNKKVKKIITIFFSIIIVVLSLCLINPIKYKIKLNKANAIIEKNKIENVSYDYIVKQLGEPWIKGNNYEEFYIKPECFCGLAYCALFVTFDEEKNIESIAIIHPN